MPAFVSLPTVCFGDVAVNPGLVACVVPTSRSTCELWLPDNRRVTVALPASEAAGLLSGSQPRLKAWEPAA